MRWFDWITCRKQHLIFECIQSKVQETSYSQLPKSIVQFKATVQLKAIDQKTLRNARIPFCNFNNFFCLRMKFHYKFGFQAQVVTIYKVYIHLCHNMLRLCYLEFMKFYLKKSKKKFFQSRKQDVLW